MDKFKKEEIVNKIAQELDITPQMYLESKKIVYGLERYLKSQNIGISVYKQGSFKLGTIIKPFKDNKDGDFDIDLVIQFVDTKENTTPSSVKTRLKAYLNNENYRDFLEEEKKRCWTLNFKNKTCAFHIDLLPCVKEDIATINKISPESFRGNSIAITEIKDKKVIPHTYLWKTSNPKGYAEWFDQINQMKYKNLKIRDKKRIFCENQQLFDSIESVSDEFTRTPLQKVIQILKRHRDVMYSNEKQDLKPISIIITTLVAKIVEENEIATYNNTYELLEEVIKGLEYYSSLVKSGISSDFADEYKTKKLITKNIVNGKIYWRIENPANSKENLADKWNLVPEKATEFFKWVKQIQIDLIDILEYKPEEVKNKLKFCLGEQFATKLFDGFSFGSPVANRILNENTSYPKPYRVNNNNG